MVVVEKMVICKGRVFSWIACSILLVEVSLIAIGSIASILLQLSGVVSALASILLQLLGGMSTLAKFATLHFCQGCLLARLQNVMPLRRKRSS